LKPQVEALSSEFAKRVNFYSLEAGPNREFLIELNISGLPSFLFYRKGKKNSFLAGSNTLIEEIRERIEMLVA
jgi:hypothetical protein